MRDYTLQTVYSGQVTITDNDTDISLSLSTSSVRESAAAQEVTVTAEFAGSSSTLSSATDVTVTVAGGSTNGATLGATGDFITDQSGNSFTVSIPAGSVSGSASFNITARDDGVTETAETVALSGSASVAGSAVTVTGASLTIQDDNAIALSLTDTSDVALGSVGEDGGSETVRVVATAPSAVASAVSVSVSVGASGSTASGSDYSAPSSATVTIASGDTSGSADITVTPTSDSVVEGDETVRFAGSAPGRDVSSVDLVIADADTGVSLAVSPEAVPEAAGAQPVTVTASFGGSSSTLTEAVDVVVTVAGGGGANGATLGSTGDFTTDATGNMLTVTIAAGSVSGSGSFNITAPDESTTEGVETVALSGAATVGGSAVTVTGVDLVIADTLIALSLTDTSDGALSAVGEDGGSETVRVVATAPSAVSNAVTVSVTVGGSGSTASRGADYSAPSSATVTISSGATSGHVDIAVSPRSDAVVEDHETIAFSATASGYVLSQVTGASLAITDADRTITLSWDDSVFPETGAATGANSITRDMSRVLTASLSGSSSTYGSAIAVPLSVTTAGALTAEAADITMDTASVSIAAGDVSNTATSMTIRVLDDRIAEPVETWAVTSTVAGFTVVDAQATIVDMDSLVTLTASSTALSEGSDPSGITVSAKFTTPDGNTDATSSEHAAADIGLSVAAGTAQAADFSYSPPSLNQVSIAAGAVASTASATLSGFGIVDDDITEGPETLTLTGAVSGFTVEEVTLTIAASETNIALSVSPGVLEESASEQEVTVTAAFAGSSSGLTAAVAVTVTVTGQTATLGASGDFTTDATGNMFTVTIPARRVTATETLGVTALDDATTETAPETAALSGSAMVGGGAAAVTGASFAIVDGFAELAVTDGQTPPNEVSSLEEDADSRELSLTFTVPSWLTVPVGGVEARFRVVGETARARTGAGFGPRDDFGVTYPGAAPDLSDPYPGVIALAAGDSTGTVAFTLEVNDDGWYEGAAAETIRVEAFVPAGGVQVPAEPVLLRINDDDPPPREPPSQDQGSGPPRPAGCEGRFCDEDDSVHQANIDAIASLGITLGCDAAQRWRFCPEETVTRSQMAAFMYRAVTRQTEDPPATVGEVDLFDVAADAWYHTYAQWAVAQAGFAAPDGEFEPAAEVPRSDMATMMATAFGLLTPGAQPQGIFTDMAGQDPAVIIAAEALYRVGVTIGCATDPLRYCPDRTVTRAQMASFIIRALNVDPALRP